MTTIEPLSPGTSQADLVRLSRDVLRRAGARSGRAMSVPALVGQLGLISDLLAASTTVLETIRGELVRRERAGAVVAADGPFGDEPGAAVDTLALWTGRARTTVAVARDAVDNAHVAASGLAER